MSDKLQNIVVVGGGPSGAATAKAISAKLNTSTHRLILITARPYFVHLPAMVRTTVTSEGELEKTALMPYGDYLAGKGEIKTGKVISFTSEEGGKGGGVVKLESGEEVRYSVLVLATGNTWNGPLDLPNEPSVVQSTLDSWRAKFERANDIVFVGGGAVGIEYAGEIRDFFPRKNVTIVHGDKQILNDAYPAKWRRAVLNRVEKSGTKVILDDLLDQTEPSDGVVKTRKGKSIKADLVVPTWGGRPNTGFIKASLGDNAVTSTGHVKVQNTLQLQSHPRIFAAGDIIDWVEQKQAAKAGGHAAVVAANVLALVNGSSTTVYKGSSEMIVLTVGRNGGSAYLGILWGLTFGDWFARMTKSKSLMIDMTRGAMGFPAP